MSWIENNQNHDNIKSNAPRGLDQCQRCEIFEFTRQCTCVSPFSTGIKYRKYRSAICQRYSAHCLLVRRIHNTGPYRCDNVCYITCSNPNDREKTNRTPPSEREIILWTGILYRNRKMCTDNFKYLNEHSIQLNRRTHIHTNSPEISGMNISIHNICKNSGTVWTARRARERSWLLWGASESGIVWKSNR